ncbi:histidine phosphotransferase family protein [Altericroceibacterium endophyticum]|uniref:Histidine phosphotransferase n=1 Tax=Altericroceibacterium endophyticum TaxID=1808508 RepID=A0A6I4T7V1_9SPHN|nr:histidine phosphotransferase family protein [Altericroceibacterium endophyticum]MXO66549.1 histidine phosphotransferase [Altericroceibacterium endophyticum]
MTQSSTDLAALLCSRLCHDMLSPVGALTNGLELLSDEQDDDMRQRCFELLQQSAKTSTDKLKFFRLAFGAAGGFGEDVSVSEPESLISALAGNNGRISLNWGVEGDTLPKRAVKVLLNLASIAIESLPRGGTLDIAAERGADATELVVRAAGARISFDPRVGEALDGGLDPLDVSVRTAPAHMIALLAAECGGGLQHALSSDALVMGAVLPHGND